MTPKSTSASLRKADSPRSMCVSLQAGHSSRTVTSMDLLLSARRVRIVSHSGTRQIKYLHCTFMRSLQCFPFAYTFGFTATTMSFAPL